MPANHPAAERAYQKYEGCFDVLEEAFVDPDLPAIITDEYESLAKVARELLEHVGWHGSGLNDRKEYYCEFCLAHHEDFSLTQHTESCKVTRWRAALRNTVGGEG